MITKTIFIYSNGCDRRRLDTVKITQYFKQNNYIVVNEIENANLIVLVTCAYKQSKIDECYELINEFNEYSGDFLILGCLAKLNNEKLKRKFNGKMLTTKELFKIDQLFPHFKFKFTKVAEPHNVPYEKSNFLVKHSSKEKFAIIRIANGCLGSCSYCVIPLSTGKLKSKPINYCLQEYTEILNRGYRRILIASEDVGAYGLDIGSSFFELLTKFLETDNKFGNIEWKIQTLNPKWAVKYKNILIELVKREKIITLECDIQSGNSRILKLMNRYYHIERICDTLTSLKESNPKLHIKSHFIVGFPSETESEFYDSLDVMKQLKLNTIQVFPYSDMEGAESYKLPKKISNEIINKRLLIVKTTFEKKGYFSELDSHRLTLINPKTNLS